MASLQARHSRSCAIGKPWTPAAMVDGCNCGPTFYVVVREDRKLVRERAGKNRKNAERALTKIQSQTDEGEFRAQRNIKFEAWADEWKDSLRGPKQNTINSYVSTLDYAKDAFGYKVVRRLDLADVKRMIAIMRAEKISDSTQAKHLRVLGSCLESAIRNGCAARNPVRDLPRAERPKAKNRGRESAYFTDDELLPLFAAIGEGLSTALCKTALLAGLRQGELLALRWADADLIGAVIHIRRNYTARLVETPKSFTSKRDVHIQPRLVGILGAWWGECGHPGNDALVFPGRGCDGYLSASTLTKRILYPAMQKAGIPREGPTGEKRTFHSFRHTFARIALENGRDLAWLSRHLGHSSIAVTDQVYGHFSEAASKRQVAALEGVFGV